MLAIINITVELILYTFLYHDSFTYYIICIFLGQQRIFINTHLYVLAIFVGRNGIIYHFKAKLAYTFSPTEEKLNQQLPTKKERKGGLVK